MSTRIWPTALIFLVVMVALQFTRIQAVQTSNELLVHEWGTFTSLQDEHGRQLGGINVDDEPVPQFVHQLFPDFILGSQHARPTSSYAKGLPARYPFVTLRLETPVMYFYPPQSQSGPHPLDIEVQFRGWLTQFYPNAVANGPHPENLEELSRLTLGPDTFSSLKWSNLQIGTQADGPSTDAPVWLTPRNVQAAAVTAANGESERYLFYRGVANIDSPLSISSDASRNTFIVHPCFNHVLAQEQIATIPKLLLVHIRTDGATAFRAYGPIQVTADPNQVVAEIPTSFTEADYSPENLGQLQRQMSAALMAEGLFGEEATAMLQTWQASYFRSGGLRLFYIVPRQWTDYYLPLSISQPAKITRVMVGRTELISLEQRQLLGKLKSSPISDASWLNGIFKSSLSDQEFLAGRSDFSKLSVPIPPDYQLYLDLGRFRNALVLDEQQRRPTASLAQFIQNYNLQAFPVSDPAATPTPVANH